MARNPVNETSRRRCVQDPQSFRRLTFRPPSAESPPGPKTIKVRLRNPNAVIRLKFTLPPRSETPRTLSDSRKQNRRPSRRETVKRTAIPYNRTSDIELR
ncbi:hypothetical protein YC2023_072826 [Brassica napus]